jgi:hypothetical protein
MIVVCRRPAGHAPKGADTSRIDLDSLPEFDVAEELTALLDNIETNGFITTSSSDPKVVEEFSIRRNSGPAANRPPARWSPPQQQQLRSS